MNRELIGGGNTQPELDTIDKSIVEILRTLWERRIVILLGSFLIAALTAAFIYLESPFHTHGIYQIHAPVVRKKDDQKELKFDVPTFVEFKRISTSILEKSLFEQFLDARGLGSDPKYKATLQRFSSPEQIRGIFDPQWALTKADARELADMGSRDAATQLMGVRVASSDKNGRDAQSQAILLADFLRDAVFYVGLVDYIRAQSADLRQELIATEEKHLSEKYRYLALENKKKALEGLSLTYGTGSRTSPQGSVVSLTDSTVRYLPLSTQLLAVDSTLIDLSIALEKLRRETEQTKFRLDYYNELQEIANVARSGEAIVKALPEALAKVARSRDLADEKFKQVALRLEHEATQARDAFNFRSRFLSAPFDPQFRNTRLRWFVPAAFLGGFTFLSFCVVGISWFKKYSVHGVDSIAKK
jgi:hypothetical protein